MTLCGAIRRLIHVRAEVDPARRRTLMALDEARIVFLEAFLAQGGGIPCGDLADALGIGRVSLLIGLVGMLEQCRRARLHRDGVGLIRAADAALRLLDPDPIWPVADYRVDFVLDACLVER